MTTNDATRAALVDELAEAMYEAAPIVLSGHGVGDSIVIPWESDELDESYRYIARETATACLPIIDRLLADRAVPEPDADAVERAARALHERHWIDGWDSESEDNKRYYLEDAKAALQAALAAAKGAEGGA